MRRNALYLSLAVLVALAAASPAHAAGPLANCPAGGPYLWPGGGVNIPFNPDLGGLGPLTNAQAVAQTTTAFANWQAIPSATTTYVNTGSLPVDVTGANFGPWYSAPAPDGLSAIVYDEDGSIFLALFGTSSGILGFSGPEWVIPSTCEIIEGLGFMNGGAINGGFPAAEFLSVQHHEFGHFNNLAHTVVNGQIPPGWLNDNSGPTPFDTFPLENLFMRIETMYPFLFIGGGQDTPHPDDIASLSTLYPAPGFFSSTGTITGTIYAANGVTKLTGVNVIARNIANPYDDAVSAISSDFTDDFSQSNPLTGVYTLNGLTPGAQYAVYVDQILQGGFSTPPILLPGPEELYNGASESNNISSPDDPSIYTPVASVAGSPTTGVDIIFNGIPPGPLPLGDDNFVEIFLPWDISFCGTDYSSIFVNANGSLTFGSGDTNWTESSSAFLSGPPRIAGLWDDLSPNAGGVVSYDVDNNVFSVAWNDVPEFPSTGSNSFEITIHRSSNQIDINFGPTTASDGLTGLSCGGSITTGLEAGVDLSSLIVPGQQINPTGTAAVFEQFLTSSSPLDLADGDSLEFNAPNAFKDTREPNNTLVKATRVSLPYNTSDQYTAIEPTGGDVDIYRFDGNDGDTLLAEVVAGGLDSYLGVFDADGNLLDTDDDGGSGLLSRLVFEIPADGYYYVAVTTFPDFDFSGDGGSGGRYVLDLQTIEGTLLNLGDDDYEEVTIDAFSFPFQGSNWTSVFVNSNGSLTFGAGDTDFTESVAEFLNGPPRIAPLWDDLSPNNAGMVLVDQDASSLTVSFVGVPEFSTTGSNTFAVTLHSSGDIDIAYGATNGNDGIVGVTEGGGAADPGLTDLSAAGTLPALGTTYEQFGPGGFDLDGLTLFFSP